MQLFGLRSIYISDKYVAWHFPFSVDSPLDIFFTIYAPLPFPRTKTTVLPTKTAQAAKPLSACSVKKNMPGTLFFFWAFNQFRVYVRTYFVPGGIAIYR